MNIQQKLSCGSDKLQCVEDYLFSEIRRVICDRDIEIFEMQNEKTYVVGEDKEFVEWLNDSMYARCFSRIVIRATLQDRWASITEVTSTLRCNDKTARNIYQKCMDHKMIERDRTSEKLLFKATSRAVDIFDAYVKALYTNKGEGLTDHLTDLLQYMKLMKKHGIDYQQKRE